MKTPRMRTALLGSGAAVALLAASGPVAADEIDDLRAQINALQDKVSQLEADQTAQPSVAPAAAVESGSKPKSWLLPGTNTSMAIGGYAKLDFIYDLNSFQGDSIGIGNFASTGSAGANRQGNFKLHARQSRFYIRTWTPTDWGELTTHLEGDFFGAGGNEVVSNSDAFRKRHAYGTLGPVLAGQTWGSHMDLAALPETIDFAGPTGTRFLRQAQLRYTHNFGGGTVMTLALENPESIGATAANDAAVGAVGALAAPDHLPDGVVTLKHSYSMGHVMLAAVLREHYRENSQTPLQPNPPPPAAGGGALAAFSDSAFGWQVSISGSLNLGPNDKIAGAFTYSDGGGRYFLQPGVTTGGVILTGTSAATLGLDTIEEYGGHISYRHKWTDNIRSTVVLGYSDVNIEDEVGGNMLATGNAGCVAGLGSVKCNIANGTRDRETTVHANLIWSPVPQVNIGLEYIWGMTTYHNRANGKLSRIQLGMQYSF